MTTPEKRYSELPHDAQMIITGCAKAYDVGPIDLFADQAKRASSDLARKAAARRLHQGGMSVAAIADLFGVSRVAINNAVRVK
jgi:hypothetical protein